MTPKVTSDSPLTHMCMCTCRWTPHPIHQLASHKECRKGKEEQIAAELGTSPTSERRIWFPQLLHCSMLNAHYSKKVTRQGIRFQQWEWHRVETRPKKSQNWNYYKVVYISYFKYVQRNRDWREGWLDRGTYCFFRRSEFGFQHPHWMAHNLL